MEIILQAFVLIVQLALGGFVLWGASLCLRVWLRDLLNSRAAAAPRLALAQALRRAGFERVASLVLLALLCTTLVGLA